MLAAIRLFSCAVICSALIAPAHACIDPRGIDLNDARFADRVLVGRVQNYRIVRDPLERQVIMRLSKDPSRAHLFKRDLERIQSGELMSGDYARFDVLVHRQLLGKSPRILTVTLTRPFENSRAISGQAYVFALRPPPSELARKSYDQYFGEESPEPGLHTVVAGLCHGTFMFEVSSRYGQELIARFTESGDAGKGDGLFSWLILGGIAAANFGLLRRSRLPSAPPPVDS